MSECHTILTFFFVFMKLCVKMSRLLQKNVFGTISEHANAEKFLFNCLT